MKAWKRVRLLLFDGAALALLSARPARAATIVVNQSADTLHAAGCAATGTGDCTLRDAITFANLNEGADEIHFDIPGEEVHTITLTESLPVVTGLLTIDGYTQPGASPNTNGPGLGTNAVLLIEINGNGVQECLVLQGAHNTVRGLVVNRCDWYGIHLTGTGSDPGLPDYNPLRESVVEGNFIGTDPTGMIAQPNGRGVWVEVGCLVTVGGTTPAARNVIAGSDGTGIHLSGSGHLVAGNFVGLNATGTEALPNGAGVFVEDCCYGTTCAEPYVSPIRIGGSTTGARNVISGNRVAVSNGQVGSFILQGNFIGTDVTGTFPVPNGKGIGLGGNAEIGGTNPGEGNLISGNEGNGVSASEIACASSIRGNLIGTDVSGLLPLGNGATGVLLTCHSDSGGNTPVSSNIIAFNGANDPTGGGIAVPYGEFSGGVAIFGNSIFGNTSDGSIPDRGLAIDLGSNGPTSNRHCYPKNKPILTAAVSDSFGIHIEGTLDRAPSKTYRVEFFSNSACDPSGFGPGRTFIGFAEVTTDASCAASIQVFLPISVAAGEYITATATGPSLSAYVGALDTSEFSDCQLVIEAAVAVFEVSPDSGPSTGSTPVTIRGTGFQSGSTVTIGGQPAEGVSVSPPWELEATTPSLPPGTLNDVTVADSAGRRRGGAAGTLPEAFFADFLDVPGDHPFHDFVETIFRSHLTAGCGGGKFCPAQPVTRAQMAILLLKGKYGSGFEPPPATGTVFADVSAGSFGAAWIERLAADGITTGCGGGKFCPNAAVTRGQMAVFLLKAKHGSGYMPPDAAGIFSDVPADHPYARWIEQLSWEGITSGCGGGNFCPDEPNTRGQTAVFLTKTFLTP